MSAHDVTPAVRAAPERSYLVGLIGEGITASLTPPMHEAEAAALGLDYEYRILDLIQEGRSPNDVGAMLDHARESGFAAMNITHPCKQLVLGVVDELEPHAAALQAVNLVVFRDHRMVGYNTDWVGFRDAITAELTDPAALSHVVQIGCGGAGAATAYALLTAGAARLELTDVDGERAAALAVRMRGVFPDRTVSTIAHARLPTRLSQASGVVHATPLGMAHHPGIAFDVELLSPGAWVSDVVYRPLETELIRRAAAGGHLTLDGGRMAVGQAYASVEIITGMRPDRRRMEEHFRRLIEHENAAGGMA